MRITDQYFWNIIFLLFFFALIFLATIILESEAYMSYDELGFVDFALITLASWRFVRAIVYDKIFAFFREQFYDAVQYKTKVVLAKPEGGPKRTLADLISSPWSFGVWAVAMVAFFYLLTPYAMFPVIILALAAVVSFLQTITNALDWKAKEIKNKVESK